MFSYLITLARQKNILFFVVIRHETLSINMFSVHYFVENKSRFGSCKCIFLFTVYYKCISTKNVSLSNIIFFIEY